MSIQVICPGCHSRFKVSDQFAGKQGPCPKCKTTMSIPRPEDEVVIHAPEHSGPKDSKGQSVLKPLKRQEAKISTGMIVGGVAASLVVPLFALLLGRVLFKTADGVHVPLVMLGFGAVVLAPPLVWLGYSFLRNDELEPYRGQSLIVRVAICSVCYAALWGAFAIVKHLLGLEDLQIWHITFILPVLMVPGALTSLASLDLDGTSAAIHYGMYLGATCALRLIMGLPAF